MIRTFTRLISVAADAGTVTSANMYDNGFVTVNGKTEDGKKFTITMSIEEEEKDGN